MERKVRTYPCRFNGFTYDLEVREVHFEAAWDNGPLFFFVRQTQFPNIFHVTIVKVGWHWPPVRWVRGFESTSEL
jgi:hypothetical protein